MESQRRKKRHIKLLPMANPFYTILMVEQKEKPMLSSSGWLSSAWQASVQAICDPYYMISHATLWVSNPLPNKFMPFPALVWTCHAKQRSVAMQTEGGDLTPPPRKNAWDGEVIQ